MYFYMIHTENCFFILQLKSWRRKRCKWRKCLLKCSFHSFIYSFSIYLPIFLFYWSYLYHISNLIVQLLSDNSIINYFFLKIYFQFDIKWMGLNFIVLMKLIDIFLSLWIFHRFFFLVVIVAVITIVVAVVVVVVVVVVIFYFVNFW